MAFDPSQVGQNMAAWAAQMQQQQGQGGSGSAPILLGARLDCNVGGQLSLQGKINFDGKILAPKQRQDGAFLKLLRELGLNDIVSGMQKCAQAGAVQSCSITDITGQSHGLGDTGISGPSMGQGSSFHSPD
jgi:hypothetical protein